jgi:hypothetical protein
MGFGSTMPFMTVIENGRRVAPSPDIFPQAQRQGRQPIPYYDPGNYKVRLGDHDITIEVSRPTNIISRPSKGMLNGDRWRLVSRIYNVD